MILGLSGQLVDSVNQVVNSMKRAEAGDLSIRVPLNRKMSKEIETVAYQFNGTLEKLEYALGQEKEAREKQMNAEIRALEAQINPHFLYNTLDTINWMAIDKDEFDISNAINTLATILRYAIADSNGVVRVKDEVEWLKRYIYLQQFRLKNKFICNIQVEPEVMEYRIHKLLLQPFVENAIIHGFQGEQNQYVLEVRLKRQADYLEIEIEDNGKGMSEDIVRSMNEGHPIISEERKHIGLDNALTRLHMYCRGMEQIHVSSTLGKGTRIQLLLPLESM
jgi:two-component system sensor histidine kinase YesM